MINSFFTNIKKDLNDFLAYAHPNLHEAIRLHIIRVDKIHQEWKEGKDIIEPLLVLITHFSESLKLISHLKLKVENFMIQQACSSVVYILEELGAQLIYPQIGDNLDLDIHEPVAADVSTEYPKGTILEVEMFGCRIDKRIFRARVIIVK